MATLECQHCNFTCRRDQETVYFKHIVHFHSNEPNFLIYCNHSDYNRSFKNIKALQKHWLRQHNHTCTADENDINDVLDQPNSQDNAQDVDTAKENLKCHAAKFLLATKEGSGVSQSVLNSVKDSTKALVGEYLDIVKKTLVAKIRQEYHHEFEFSADMDALFEADGLYSGLETEYQQNSYYKKNFNLVVSINLQINIYKINF